MAAALNSGVYALLIHIPECEIEVGSLGKLIMNEGYCIYIGSAQRNMDKRIARHMRREKRMRWHIDYLLTCGEVVRYATFPLPKCCEEWIAMEMAKRFDYIRGFGSSDSRAPSHLFCGKKDDLWNEVINLMKRCENDRKRGCLHI